MILVEMKLTFFLLNVNLCITYIQVKNQKKVIETKKRKEEEEEKIEINNRICFHSVSCILSSSLVNILPWEIHEQWFLGINNEKIIEVFIMSKSSKNEKLRQVFDLFGITTRNSVRIEKDQQTIQNNVVLFREFIFHLTSWWIQLIVL